MDEKGSFRPNLLRTAYLVAFGLILHDVPEGFAMANSYIASPSLGILMAIAIAIHNVPEEFAMAVPIVAVKKRRFLYTAAFLSGLAEPVGAIIGLVAVHFHPALNSFFMAFAAGAMIFVSIHELLPMARRYHKIHLFVLGSVISVFVYMLLTAVVPG
ncbi:ZIP family metal transporter [Solemya velum gill symbiont]|uniref:ZIP family metal transporter n=1 Tax=Solemya velum gill symbiont TaxID=2340 RepID=UPI001F382A04|nr:ZIP family metal transporter [Solemya velum gill symbiont]